MEVRKPIKGKLSADIKKRYRTVEDWRVRERVNGRALLRAFSGASSAGVFLVMVNGLVFVVGQTVTQR